MTQRELSKQVFEEEIYKKYMNHGKYYIPDKEYRKIISDLKLAKESKATKSAHEYYILRKFEILDTLFGEKLIKKNSKKEEPVYYITIEEMFDVIERAHLATSHSGRCKMITQLGGKYANITREALEIFKSNCEVCQSKAEKYVENAVARSNMVTKVSSFQDLMKVYSMGKRKNKIQMTNEMIRKIKEEDVDRGYMFLIDAQSYGDANYKWILVYQDGTTKFCILRPVSSLLVSEIAFELFDIFHLFGAPMILHSDVDINFFRKVIEELKMLWPNLTLVRGSSISHSIDLMKNSLCKDIHEKLLNLMQDKKSEFWSIWLRFVQTEMNSTINPDTNMTPNASMFSSDRGVGVSSSGLPDEVLEILETEEDLLCIISILSERTTHSQTNINKSLPLAELAPNSNSTDVKIDVNIEDNSKLSNKRKMLESTLNKAIRKKRKKSVQKSSTTPTEDISMITVNCRTMQKEAKNIDKSGSELSDNDCDKNQLFQKLNADDKNHD